MPDQNTLSSEIPQLSLSRAFLLQLLPGVFSSTGFLILAYSFRDTGASALFFLALAVVVLEVPVSFWLMARELKREGQAGQWHAAFPWRKRLKLSRYLLIGLPLIVMSIAAMGIFSTQVGPVLRAAWFSWVPAWAIMAPGGNPLGSVPLGLFMSVVLAMIFIGGTVQELYARGFLLPRIAHKGAIAPLIGAVYFAVMHLIAPWDWPAFLIIALLWSYTVWWTRSVWIGVFAHVGMLLLNGVMTFLMATGNLQAPH